MLRAPIRRREREAIQAARNLRNHRAMELFANHLTAEQRASHEAHRFIMLTSNLGNAFRIYTTGMTGNVARLERNSFHALVELRLCAHPVGYPLGDALLTQLLMLLMDEAEFLRIANPYTTYEYASLDLRWPDELIPPRVQRTDCDFTQIS